MTTIPMSKHKNRSAYEHATIFYVKSNGVRKNGWVNLTGSMGDKLSDHSIGDLLRELVNA